MMKQWLLLLTILSAWPLHAAPTSRFGEKLCKEPDYYCLKVKSGDTWLRLFPDEIARNLVKRVNRMNVPIRRGMILAVPKQLDRLTIFDLAPFPRSIVAPGERVIYVSQQQLAWAAYDESGELLWWGPISSGMSLCPGVYGGCKTPSGAFRIIRKQDVDCVSTAFPRRSDGDNGGAEMPYCMHFFRGFALHGSNELPGYRASHGCIRLFVEDARWLNEDFIKVPEEGYAGTRVIIDDRL